MITAEQSKLRRLTLGSSDAAAVLGHSPFATAADVWLEKTGRVEPFAGNDATERGNLLEPALLTYAEGVIGKPIRRDVMLTHPNGLLHANVDAIDVGFLSEAGAEFVVEAKSANCSEDFGWGEVGTEEVPAHVLIQTHHQMLIAGPQCVVAWVPVLLAPFGRISFQMYRVGRDNDLCRIIEDRCSAFMEKHVRADVPPAERPSPEVLRRRRRTPSSVVTIPDVAVAQLRHAKAATKAAKAVEAEAETALLACLGDAEAGAFSGGQVTFYEQRRKAYTVAESAHRVLRLPKVKDEVEL